MLRHFGVKHLKPLFAFLLFIRDKIEGSVLCILTYLSTFFYISDQIYSYSFNRQIII